MTPSTWSPFRVLAAYFGLFAVLLGSIGQNPWMGAGYLLAALLLLAYEAKTPPRADETGTPPTTPTPTAARRWLSMDMALTDMRGVCWICQQDAAVLELLDVGSRFELACRECADALIKSWGERAA